MPREYRKKNVKTGSGLLPVLALDRLSERAPLNSLGNDTIHQLAHRPAQRIAA